MASWKEKYELEKESLKLGLAETGIASLGFFRAFPPRKRHLVVALLIAIIPVTIAARYGLEAWTSHRLESTLVSAHPAFVDPAAPVIGEVKILTANGAEPSAYVEVSNPNIDLAAPNIPYEISFYDASGFEVTQAQGYFYLLPDQTKFLIVPRLDSTERLVSGKVTLGSFSWQKQFVLPEVELRAVQPLLYNQTNPLTLVAEGSVVNNSPYRLKAVRLVFLLEDAAGRVVAVSQRDEFDVSAFARRAYKQFFPNLYKEGIVRVRVLADTNVLDSSNLVLEQAGTGNFQAPRQ